MNKELTLFFFDLQICATHENLLVQISVIEFLRDSIADGCGSSLVDSGLVDCISAFCSSPHPLVVVAALGFTTALLLSTPDKPASRVSLDLLTSHMQGSNIAVRTYSSVCSKLKAPNFQISRSATKTTAAFLVSQSNMNQCDLDTASKFLNGAGPLLLAELCFEISNAWNCFR